MTHNPANDILRAQWYNTPNTQPVIEKQGQAVVNYILEKAGANKVVMFNEQHFHPKHRAFVSSLLAAFYERGYCHLALESLVEPADSLMARKYPIQNTGFYTKEPQMARLIRHAIEIGFTLVEYDNFEQSQNREYEQAATIYRQTLQKDSAAKVLVLAGIAHISKAEADKRMAYYFTQLSGIIPYSINQADPEIYASHIPENTIYSIAPQSNDCDLFLINNWKDFTDDVVIRNHENVKNVHIKFPKNVLQEQAPGHPLSLSVYAQKEFQQYNFNAVPLLNYLLAKGEANISLPFSAGNYKVVVRSPGGNCVHDVEITVE